MTLGLFLVLAVLTLYAHIVSPTLLALDHLSRLAESSPVLAGIALGVVLGVAMTPAIRRSARNLKKVAWRA